MHSDKKLKVMKNSLSHRQELEKTEILQHMFHRFTLEQLKAIFDEATEKYPPPEPPKELTPKEVHIKWKQENGKEIFNNLNYINHETVRNRI
jgi:hypothetical protein